MKQPSQKTNIMCLSRELSDADRTVRPQMIVANMDDKEKRSSESVWTENGYFGDINPDFSIHKKDFPENALLYANQTYLTVKDGDTIIYCDYAILGQIIPLKNPPENLDEAVSNDETNTLVKMYTPMYDNLNGKFLGVKETLGYIMLRNEPEETFLTYGFSADHSNILFCFSKKLMPNIFHGTAFNSHKLETFAENKAKRSDLFFYLPSITDRKEAINRYKDQVSLAPVTSAIADICKFAPECYEFDPIHLDQSMTGEACANAWLTLYRYFANVCKVSNADLMQNVYALIKDKSIDHSTLK